MTYSLAIDIGASGGRHIVGWRCGGEIKTVEIYRFKNGMDTKDGHLVWDTERLLSEVKTGIRESLRAYPDIKTVSIDTWGVDYVLLRENEEVYPVYAYRDSRVDEAIERVHEIISYPELYNRTGIQFNTFNTVYQLYADKLAGRLEGVTDFLMIPEYLMYKLTGVKKKEYTNASTMGLLNAMTKDFDVEIFERLGLPKELIAPLSQPGTLVGRFTDEVAAEVGGNMDVVFCATHDTGSAVEAIDMKTNSPYISSGTWSLFGVKLDSALTDDNSRNSGYSNEGGVGYIRYLKNITGMWIVQSLRSELCPDTDYGDIADMAAGSDFTETFDVNEKSFMAPESMAGAIDSYLSSRGLPTPKSVADYFNSAYHSLAKSYREAVLALENNLGVKYSEIYIVGGGAKNGYLNSLAERYTEKKIVALPIEATAIGNLKVQLDYCEKNLK